MSLLSPMPNNPFAIIASASGSKSLAESWRNRSAIGCPLGSSSGSFCQQRSEHVTYASHFIACLRLPQLAMVGASNALAGSLHGVRSSQM